ncbi:hypothetical protein GP5015_997 [gamma proteobacterium HTCC5015]|nr:hypothetical protein GP5015_997 [gamma proteobacterium HTCC5015]
MIHDLWNASLGPVNANLMVTVVTKKAPIKAQGAWFGESK